MNDFAFFSMLGTMLAHLVATIWWAASMTTRVAHIEHWISSNERTAERLAALEERIAGIGDGVSRIEHFIRRGK